MSTALIFIVMFLTSCAALVFLVRGLDSDGPLIQLNRGAKKRARDAEEMLLKRQQTLAEIRQIAVDNRMSDPGYDLIVRKVDESWGR